MAFIESSGISSSRLHGKVDQNFKTYEPELLKIENDEDSIVKRARDYVTKKILIKDRIQKVNAYDEQLNETRYKGLKNKIDKERVTFDY